MHAETASRLRHPRPNASEPQELERRNSADPPHARVAQTLPIVARDRTRGTITEGLMRILLATDGSIDAKAAATYLEQFPLTPSSRVRIVSVTEPRVSRADLPALGAYYEALDADRERLLDETRSALTIPNTVETAVLRGVARDEIVREAHEWGADLVVTGARGLGALDALLLGSVSLAVAHHANCAVLVVKGQGYRLRRLIVGIDGSEESMDAARFLTGLRLEAGHHVELVGAVEPVHFPSTAPFTLHEQLRAVVREIHAERRTVLAKAMNEVTPPLEAAGASVSRTVVEGHPAAVITTRAALSGAGLVVVGARGLGGVKRLLLGSVSDSVLRAAECPVLIVKHPPRT
jgi:nucleotide-binding universal stress UspA family protein